MERVGGTGCANSVQSAPSSITNHKHNKYIRLKSRRKDKTFHTKSAANTNAAKRYVANCSQSVLVTLGVMETEMEQCEPARPFLLRLLHYVATVCVLE